TGAPDDPRQKDRRDSSGAVLSTQNRRNPRQAHKNRARHLCQRNRLPASRLCVAPSRGRRSHLPSGFPMIDDTHTRTTNTSTKNAAPTLRFTAENLRVGYGRRAILPALSFQIHAGEIWALF